MQEIGFGQQPYLVYRHHDAGHPHCHIVTTHIRSDGTPIELYNIGRNQSEEARLRIEEEFHLVTTEQKQTQRLRQRLIHNLHGHRDSPNPIEYGKSGLTRQISDVLDYVTEKYKYTSLEEFNLVLHQFNLEAYRGKENTQLYESRGLLYRVLNEQGSYIGVPLKASFFDSQPTLDNLEKQFIQHLTLKQEHLDQVNVKIAWELRNEYRDLDYIVDQLRYENIRMVRRHDKDGNCTSVHYIDHATNCIYTGEELGPKCDHRLIQRVIERDRREQLEETQTQRHRLRHRF